MFLTNVFLRVYNNIVFLISIWRPTGWIKKYSFLGGSSLHQFLIHLIGFEHRYSILCNAYYAIITNTVNVVEKINLHNF